MKRNFEITFTEWDYVKKDISTNGRLYIHTDMNSEYYSTNLYSKSYPKGTVLTYMCEAMKRNLKLTKAGIYHYTTMKDLDAGGWVLIKKSVEDEKHKFAKNYTFSLHRNFVKTIIGDDSNPDVIMVGKKAVNYIGFEDIVDIPYGIEEVDISYNSLIEILRLPSTIKELSLSNLLYLETIEIEDGVSDLSKNFHISDCPNLKKVVFPLSLKKISKDPFIRCPYVKKSTYNHLLPRK